jgi:hypothetical protein
MKSVIKPLKFLVLKRNKNVIIFENLAELNLEKLSNLKGEIDKLLFLTNKREQFLLFKKSVCKLYESELKKQQKLKSSIKIEANIFLLEENCDSAQKVKIEKENKITITQFFKKMIKFINVYDNSVRKNTFDVELIKKKLESLIFSEKYNLQILNN